MSILSKPIEYLKHIRDECEYVIQKSQDLTKEVFLGDETIKRAFVRSIEIIGEASKKVPDEYKSQHQNIQWKEMAGMRDVLIHGYFGINYNIVWDVVTSHLPDLYKDISNLILEEE